MRWTDIRHLEKGDVITYGDHAQMAKCSYTREGIVQHVTVRGGIKVQPLDQTRRPIGAEVWVPYHHVISFPTRRPKRRAHSAY